MLRLAIVSSDPHAVRVIRSRFEEEGFRIDAFTESKPGLSAVRERRFDVVIVDLEATGSGAIALTRELRELRGSTLPVLIFVTNDEGVRAEALQGGADGCASKPLNGRELLARVQAMLRTIDTRNPSPTRYDDGVLAVDLRAQTATVRGEPVPLSASEGALLALLIRLAPMSLQAEQISLELAGTDQALRPTTIDGQVKSLRKKIGRGYLEGRPGYGYSFLSRSGR